MKIGTPVNVTESTSYQQVYPMYSAEESYNDAAMVETPVSAGTVEVTAQVSVSYNY